MDGTLLGHDSRVSPRSAQILGSLSRKGVLFTVATARTPATVDPLMKDISPSIPAVVMTGAALWDFNRRCYIDPIFIPRDEVLPILDGCRSHGVNPFVYVLGDDDILDVYIDPPLSKAQCRFVDDRSHLRLKRFHVGSGGFDLDRDGDRVILIYAMGDIDRVNMLASRARQQGHCAVSAYPDIFNHSVGNLEIFAPGVSKASGVTRLARLVGSDDITVFGDNLNDLPMMEIATRSVAVGNAARAVRDAADITIGPNSCDSVARFINSENMYT